MEVEVNQFYQQKFIKLQRQTAYLVHVTTFKQKPEPTSRSMTTVNT